MLTPRCLSLPTIPVTPNPGHAAVPLDLPELRHPVCAASHFLALPALLAVPRPAIAVQRFTRPADSFDEPSSAVVPPNIQE